METLKFKAYEQCPKCGRYLGDCDYETNRVKIGFVKNLGYLFITCQRCKYSWREHTKDYVAPPPEPKVVVIASKIPTIEEQAEIEVTEICTSLVGFLEQVKVSNASKWDKAGKFMAIVFFWATVLLLVVKGVVH